MIYKTLLVILLITAILLIALIILQQDKNSNTRTTFGTGNSNALFSPSSSSRFMTRITTILAALFLSVCLIMCNVNNYKITGESERKNLTKTEKTEKVQSIPQADVIINNNTNMDIPR